MATRRRLLQYEIRVPQDPRAGSRGGTGSRGDASGELCQVVPASPLPRRGNRPNGRCHPPGSREYKVCVFKASPSLPWNLRCGHDLALLCDSGKSPDLSGPTSPPVRWGWEVGSASHWAECRTWLFCGLGGRRCAPLRAVALPRAVGPTGRFGSSQQGADPPRLLWGCVDVCVHACVCQHPAAPRDPCPGRPLPPACSPCPSARSAGWGAGLCLPQGVRATGPPCCQQQTLSRHPPQSWQGGASAVPLRPWREGRRGKAPSRAPPTWEPAEAWFPRSVATRAPGSGCGFRPLGPRIPVSVGEGGDRLSAL